MVTIGADTYAATIFPVPPNPATSVAPTDLAIGGGKVWMVAEFSDQLYGADLAWAAPQNLTAIPIPAPTNPPLFATMIFGDHSITFSNSSERVLALPDGSVLFSQGGAALYSGAHPNASRLMRYYPATGAWKAYNLPADNLQIAGLLADANGYWTTAFRSGAGLVIRLDDFGGVKAYPVPGTWGTLAHLAPWGNKLLLTDGFANAIRIFDPATGTAQGIALPPNTGGNFYNSYYPWRIVPDLLGQPWWFGNAAPVFGRVDPTSLTSAEFFTVPVPAGEACASGAFDTQGRLWLTTGRHLARMNINRTIDVSSDLVTAIGMGLGSGLAIDPMTQDIWAPAYVGQALVRLRKQ